MKCCDPCAEFWSNWPAKNRHLKSVPKQAAKRRSNRPGSPPRGGAVTIVRDRVELNDKRRNDQTVMKMKLRKAVFPAAGLGTRFLPATKAQPKEMLPLVDKPIIQYGVEEAMASGCDQIVI